MTFNLGHSYSVSDIAFDTVPDTLTYVEPETVPQASSVSVSDQLNTTYIVRPANTDNEQTSNSDRSITDDESHPEDNGFNITRAGPVDTTVIHEHSLGAPQLSVHNLYT